MPRKKKSEIMIPKARQLPSGNWFIRLRLDGKSIPVTEETEAKCKAKALAIKAGYINAPAKVETVPTLGEVIDSYIASKDGVLSPATIRGYNIMRKNQFADYMGKAIDGIDWQRMVNAEAKTTKPKTVKNAWALCAAALKAQTGMVYSVTVPMIVKNEHAFLTAEQIPIFIAELCKCRSQTNVIAALLALHSLRMSEIKGLTWDDIDLDNDIIHVRGAMVIGKDNKLVAKDTNKNLSSRRDIPIIIPELKMAMFAVTNKTGYVVSTHPSNVYEQINRVCAKCKFPAVGVHGLRHSFASLCYHLQVPEKVTMRLGGWADDGTMKKIYTHISEKDVSKNTDKLTDFFKVQNGNENVNGK